MATLSVGPGNHVRPHRCVRTVSFPEGPAQVFVVGDLLTLNTTADKGNQVVLAGADPTVIVGFAAEKASGVENTPISVWVADECGEFLMHVADTQVLDNDDIGNGYEVVRDTAGTPARNIWRVDRTGVTADAVIVMQLIDAHGDVNGRVVVRIPAAARFPLGSTGQ